MIGSGKLKARVADLEKKVHSIRPSITGGEFLSHTTTGVSRSQVVKKVRRQVSNDEGGVVPRWG